jgi:hypothetical protein
MTLTERFSVARCGAVARAEYRKVWMSSIPLVILLALPVGTYLFVFELYHVERVADRLHFANALDALPLLFFTTWKTLLFQATALTFAAFWTTVDSQYGMIRVACCQPVTRVEYLIGKWFGITAHMLVFTVALVALELLWVGLYSGLRGVRGHDAIPVAWCAAELAVFMVSLTSIVMAIASVRRTVGGGIVAAAIGFILLALMTTLPFDVMPPRFVFMRYFFFPLGELRDAFPSSGDSPMVQVHTVADFFRAVLVTPALFIVPAIAYFRTRDIIE